MGKKKKNKKNGNYLNYKNISKQKKPTKKQILTVSSIVAVVFLIAVISIIFVCNIKTEVYIDFTVDGEVIYSGKITVKGINPTVLKATELFAKEKGIEYTYDDEKKPTTIKSFDGFVEHKDYDAESLYFWEFGLNEISVYDITGRASNNKIKNGDEIHWYYSAMEFPQ
ncbi:MAG: DUF4430 domain-containing protein [Clostridia bacterium]|nr:DUF4430 domain-containing protein [Clostridia bacterium]